MNELFFSFVDPFALVFVLGLFYFDRSEFICHF